MRPGVPGMLSKTGMRIALGVLLAAGLTGCGSTASPAPATPSGTSVVPSVAGVPQQEPFDIDVGNGRTIHGVCAGPVDAAKPTVVFENGAGPTLSTWSAVMNQVAATARVCGYDRAGVGQSDDAAGPRTTRDQVADLAAALEGAGVDGKLILVAHSRGAWNAIVYTADHSDQVAGIVLVDADPPGLDARWLAELPPETAGEPADIAEARMIMSDHSNDPSVTTEHLDLEASQEEVEAAPGFGDRPTEILWATKTGATEWPASFDADLVARLNGVFEELRGDIEGLADDAKVTMVDSGHSIQEEQPAAVVDAINRVLTRLGPAG